MKRTVVCLMVFAVAGVALPLHHLAPLVAAVSFDQTGSTRIGRYLLNHSFMRPGLVTMVTAILIAWALSALVPL